MTGAGLGVAIVSHNSAAELPACLASLEAGGLEGLAARVAVTDNASADGTVAATRERFGWVTVLENADNPGFAAASNQGLRAVGFEGDDPPRHALLLNPDTIVPPGALRRLVDALEREADVGVVGPKLVLPDGRLDLACRRAFPTPEVAFYRFSGLSRLFPKSRRMGRYNMTFLDPDEPADVDSVVGACMLVRGAAIAQVGLLDERFWMYGEDLDWCLRIHRAGWRVAYRPEVVIQHVKRASSTGSRRARFEFQRAMWLFYRKHYADATPRLVHWAVMAGIALRGGPELIREMRADGARA